MNDIADRLHDLASSLFAQAVAESRHGYMPFAIRIDAHGWRTLLSSKKAMRDGSFDSAAHPDKYRWRDLECILIWESAEAVGKPIKPGEVIETCEMLCIEARQRGENGRRKYFDATPEQLEAIFEAVN